MYENYRCRKCGMIIAKKINKYDMRKQSYGVLVEKKYHRNCFIGIQDREKVFADLISVSDKLLSDTVDVVGDDDDYMSHYEKEESLCVF